MAELRALLHEMVAAPEAPSDLRARRATWQRRRARRRMIATGVVLVLAVVGFQMVDASRLDPVKVKTVSPSPRPPAETQDFPVGGGGANGVATDGNDVWVAAGAGPTRQYFAVERLDARTGTVKAIIEMPRVVDFVAIGLGRVWAFGGGDGGEPDGGIAVIDPATNTVVATSGWARGRSPSSITFGFGSAWVGDGQGSVLRADVVGDTVKLARIPVSTSGAPVVTSDAIWVRSSDARTIAKIDPRTNTVLSTEPWTGILYSTAGANSVWTSDGSRVVELFPDNLASGLSVALGRRLTLPVEGPAFGVEESAGGIWIAQEGAVSWFQPGEDRATATVRHFAASPRLAVVGTTAWMVGFSFPAVTRWIPVP